MKHALRNLVVASVAGALITLVSSAFGTGPQFLPFGTAYFYYGFPFPVYEVKAVDMVGSFDYYLILNAVGDVLVWWGISFAVIASLQWSRDLPASPEDAKEPQRTIPPASLK